MRIVAYRDVEPNFGDELNHWLWPRLLPGFFDDDENSLFLGIGSILFDHFPTAARKIVLGAGYGGYTPPPVIDANWQVYFVRGPRTAAQLGLAPELAVGDAAILLRDVVPHAERAIRYSASFMPHYESAMIGNWEAVCRRAGVHYIDPRHPVDTVLDDILASRLVITEAMHGAIVADTLRVPWCAILPSQPVHHAKWFDWAEALGITLKRHRLGASSPLEWLSARCAPFPWLVRQIKNRRARLRRTLLAVALPTTARRLRYLAEQPGQLSDAAALDAAHLKMRQSLSQLQRDFNRKS